MAYSRQYDWEEDRRQTTEQGNRALQSTSDSIMRSHVIAIETENVGNEVLSDLSEQRESLLRSRAQVDNMQSGLRKSNRILSAMSRHVLYNKILLILIIVLEVIILAALIYIRFIRKK